MEQTPVPEPESVRTVVIYDSDDGRIVHLHQTVILPGATSPPQEDLERTVRDLLAKNGVDTARMRALHVTDAKLRRDVRYRVDTERSTLVEAGLAQPDRREPDRG